jgi:hypothetical protein
VTRGADRGRAAVDVYGFGQTFTDTNNISVHRGQGSLKGKLVDVVSLVVPKTKVSPAAFAAAWSGYSATKSLALASACVPRAVGVEDDGDDISYHYEWIPARSLSSLM